MNNSFSLQQIYRTGNLDPNLISRQYKLDLMSKSMCINFENPKIKQCEIANQLGYSTSNLQRYRNDINMLSPYRINPINTNKRTKKGKNTTFDTNSHRDPNVKRPQLTSNDLKIPQSTSKENSQKVKAKNSLKSGFVQENVEINDQFLDEIHQNNNH